MHCHATDRNCGTPFPSIMIRKYVVCRLMEAQNRIEDVSKWLGHQAVNTTYAFHSVFV